MRARLGGSTRERGSRRICVSSSQGYRVRPYPRKNKTTKQQRGEREDQEGGSWKVNRGKGWEASGRGPEQTEVRGKWGREERWCTF